MPSQKAKNGEYRDVAHPLNSETRTELERIILNAYNEALKNPAAYQGEED
jgi:stage V sporulation protein G